MNSRNMKQLFHVSSWNRTQKNDGIVVNVSAFDEDAQTWINARVYVPFKLNEKQTYAKTTLAKAGRMSIPSDKAADATQTKSCAVVRIPVERVFEGAEHPKKMTEKPKEQTAYEDGETPFD